MKKNSEMAVIVVLIVVFSFVLLGIMLGKYISRTQPLETVNVSCPNTMAEVIESSKGDVYNMEDDPNYIEPTSYYLVKYSVDGDEIVNPVFDQIPADLADEQKDKALQLEAWQIFANLIPAKDRQMVTQYNIFTDGTENTLAAVDQIAADPSQWVIEVDIADLENKDALLFTLIHEYAHLLTLNASQVSVDEEIYNDPFNTSLIESKTATCPHYFTGTGCSLPNSYINAFYLRFWEEINPEWEKIDTLQYADDLMPYYNGLYNFYLAHPDQFLDDYSTTHPAEDIAESFTYFVFSSKPKENSIKDKKILFFYEYPELVELRQSILESTCAPNK